MLIHQITKKSQVDEGLLSNVKDSISSGLSNMGTNMRVGLGLGSSNQLALLQTKQNNDRAAKASAALAKKGYNVTTSAPTAALTVQQAAVRSKLKNSPLSRYIGKTDTTQIGNIAKSFNPTVNQPSANYGAATAMPVNPYTPPGVNARTATATTAQTSTDIAQMKAKDDAARHQISAQDLAQRKQTQASDSTKAQQDNNEVAQVKAIKAKQATGQLVTPDELTTLKFAARKGIKEDQQNNTDVASNFTNWVTNTVKIPKDILTNNEVKTQLVPFLANVVTAAGKNNPAEISKAVAEYLMVALAGVAYINDLKNHSATSTQQNIATSTQQNIATKVGIDPTTIARAQTQLGIRPGMQVKQTGNSAADNLLKAFGFIPGFYAAESKTMYVPQEDYYVTKHRLAETQHLKDK